jgi:hypothetical protein
MIFKRLAKGIKDQDWLIAIMEVMIVVVGIFIGLQVDDWSKAREDRALERQYLERLHQDIVGSLEDQRANSTWDAERIRTQAIMRTALSSGILTEENRADFDLGLAYLGVHNPLILHWTTMEELKSSGNIALIDNLELRAHLGATRAEYERVLTILERQKNVTALLLSDIMSDYELVEASGRMGAEVELAYDFEELVSNREFLNRVSHLNRLSKMTVQIQQAHIQRLERLRDALAANLDSSD